MGMDPTDIADRSERLERMMEHYRAAAKHRQLEAAMKLWRLHEAREVLAALERAPERVH
jgi:hypothetical protein